MSRLLIIYLVLALVTRVIRGFQESQRSAPKGRTPREFSAEEEAELLPEAEVNFGGKGERKIVAPQPSLADQRPPAAGEGVTLEWAEFEETSRREEEGKKKPALSRLPQERPAAKELFSQPEAWVQGIIMSEVLLPPRSQRPWRSPIQ